MRFILGTWKLRGKRRGAEVTFVMSKRIYFIYCKNVMRH